MFTPLILWICCHSSSTLELNDRDSAACFTQVYSVSALGESKTMPSVLQDGDLHRNNPGSLGPQTMPTSLQGCEVGIIDIPNDWVVPWHSPHRQEPPVH